MAHHLLILRFGAMLLCTLLCCFHAFAQTRKHISLFWSNPNRPKHLNSNPFNYQIPIFKFFLKYMYNLPYLLSLPQRKSFYFVTIFFTHLALILQVSQILGQSLEWLQTSSPTRVNTLTIENNTLFMGTQFGIYISKDNGLTWSGTTILTSVNTIAVSGNTILAGTIRGIYRSIDNGITWTVTQNAISGEQVSSIIVNGSTIFAGLRNSSFRVYRSTDNGANWTAANKGLESQSVYSMAFNTAALFAGTLDGGVFRSTDNGTTWTVINSGITNKSIRGLAVNGNTIFAGTNGNGIFRSSDNGNSWTEVSTGLTNKQIQSVIANQGVVYAITDSGVFRSIDNGELWTSVVAGPFVTLGFNDTTLWNINNLGVLQQSQDKGSTWITINSGLLDYVSAIVTSGSSLFAGVYNSYTGGVYQSQNNGSTWSLLTTSTSSRNVRALVVIGSSVFAGTDSGIYRSTDNGKTWAFANSGLSISLNGNRIRSLAVNGSTIFAGTEGGVFRSSDNGNTWTIISIAGVSNQVINILLVNGSSIFVGTENNGIFRSLDNGITWSEINTGIIRKQITALTVSGTALFVGAGNSGIYRSTDNGNTWIPVNTGISGSNLSINSLVASGNTIFAATKFDRFPSTQLFRGNAGLFRSNNNGSSWIADNKGLTVVKDNSGVDQYVTTLLISNNMIFAGTNGGGIFRTSLIPTSIRIESKPTVTLVAYPNPSSDFVELEYEILAAAYVRLDVISLLGQKVLSLVNEPQQAGKHTFNVDMSSFTNGLYFFRLSVNGEQTMRSLQVVR